MKKEITVPDIPFDPRTGERCRACSRPIPPGSFLTVSPLDGSEPFRVCRPSRTTWCITAAGTVHQAAVSISDPAAADRYDRQRALADDASRAADG